MAPLTTVKLSRYDSTPWGFRLQGGKDFGTPLVIQKVNGGSLAEKAGLQVGDALIKVNNVDVSNMRHKDAQDVIVRSGNSFEFTIQRGGVVTSTWKPAVTPVGHVPSPAANFKSASPALVTKTSLAHKGPPAPLIGSSHNTSPHPFVSSVNGHDNVKSALVNKQYNSPVGIYSEESIAETLSAQAEVLAGGVLGVNFKKNEKNYTPSNSEVLKMVKEADQEPKSPEPDENRNSLPPFGNHVTTNPPSATRHVQAPTTSPNLPPGQNICADCERLIVGVFVRIKEKNLHVECFKCATCGTSLKNVGYYNINNKLYCDVHAKMIARQNPPAAGLEPVTVPYGTKPPANTISAALTSHKTAPKSPSLPSYQTPPAPYHPPPPQAPSYQPSNLPPYSPSPNLSGPKPFGVQSNIKPQSGTVSY